jgi:hypothetical protein
MDVSRKERKHIRRTDAIATKERNSALKAKERARRDARMMDRVKTGEPPFSPAVMSWLSRKLHKRSTRITPQDVRSLVG